MKLKDIEAGVVYTLKASRGLVVPLDTTAMYYMTHPYNDSGRVYRSDDARFHRAPTWGRESATGLLCLKQTNTHGRVGDLSIADAAKQVSVEKILAGDHSVPSGYRLEFINPTQIEMTWEEWLPIAAKREEDRKLAERKEAQRKQHLASLQDQIDGACDRLGMDRLVSNDGWIKINTSWMLSILENLEQAENGVDDEG